MITVNPLVPEVNLKLSRLLGVIVLWPLGTIGLKTVIVQSVVHIGRIAHEKLQK